MRLVDSLWSWPWWSAAPAWSPSASRTSSSDVVEAARPVGADDHAVEAVAQVEGDRDERLDLLVGRARRIAAGDRLVLAHDLVGSQHLAGEALRHVAVGWVVVEPVRDDDVERAVAVGILAGQEHPLLRLDELDGRLQHEVPDVAGRVGVGCPARVVQALDLPTQLAVPLALGAARPPETLGQLALAAELVLRPAQRALQALALAVLSRVALLAGLTHRGELGLGRRPRRRGAGEVVVRRLERVPEGDGAVDRAAPGKAHRPCAERQWQEREQRCAGHRGPGGQGYGRHEDGDAEGADRGARFQPSRIASVHGVRGRAPAALPGHRARYPDCQAWLPREPQPGSSRPRGPPSGHRASASIRAADARTAASDTRPVRTAPSSD